MNLLEYDAMAFGNHEFDDGIEGVLPFLEEISFPVVNSNIDASGTKLHKRFQKFLIKQFGAEKIGIIGYTSTETPDLSTTGSLRFNDEIESLREIVKELEEMKIDKIVAVGHAGIVKDREICRLVKVSLTDGYHKETAGFV
ncbi:MAG: hypothetical protein GY853_16110 [PVC group bacterium]|nr:hypothetical protein [PVC group bacterium]